MRKLQTRPLTTKQRVFVAEYLLDLNAREAAIRAGYSPRSAGHIAYNLLHRSPPVTEAIKEAMAARAERVNITAERVLKEFARIAFADIRRFTEWGPEGVKVKSFTTLSDDDAAAVAEVHAVSSAGGKPKIKLHDKKAALVMIARHLGLIGKQFNSAPVLPPSEDDDIPARELLRRKLQALAEEGIE